MYDSPLETGLGLVLPFAAYLAAEELHASGVLAVVVAGLVIGHYSTDASIMTRLQERSVWSSLDTLLEMFVFAYRSEEHTSELQSLMRSSYAVLCLKTKILEH